LKLFVEIEDIDRRGIEGGFREQQFAVLDVLKGNIRGTFGIGTRVENLFIV